MKSKIQMTIVVVVALTLGWGLCQILNKLDGKFNPIPKFIQTVSCEGEWHDFYVIELTEPWVLCQRIPK